MKLINRSIDLWLSCASQNSALGVILFGLAMIRGDFDAQSFSDHAR
jgi:hypothetical protein